MKEIIRCKHCANAAIKLPVGFAGKPELICTHRSGTVDVDDGCTFGAPGEQSYAVTSIDITLGDAAIVNGE